MNKEIERKYAVAYLPDRLQIEKIQEIQQVFIYQDANTIIRIRKIETKFENGHQQLDYIYTVKTKGDFAYDDRNPIGQKYEIESRITKEEYEKLLPRKISNQITKTRVVVPIQKDLKVEIDIYYDYLEGFLTAEVEFADEKKAKEFMKPNWLGEELGYKNLSNRKLAQMNEEQFKSKVSEEFINHNKVIIAELKQLIKTSY